MDVKSVASFVKNFLTDLTDPILGFELSSAIFAMKTPELSMLENIGTY